MPTYVCIIMRLCVSSDTAVGTRSTAAGAGD